MIIGSIISAKAADWDHMSRVDISSIEKRAPVRMQWNIKYTNRIERGANIETTVWRRKRYIIFPTCLPPSIYIRSNTEEEAMNSKNTHISAIPVHIYIHNYCISTMHVLCIFRLVPYFIICVGTYSNSLLLWFKVRLSFLSFIAVGILIIDSGHV